MKYAIFLSLISSLLLLGCSTVTSSSLDPVPTVTVTITKTPKPSEDIETGDQASETELLNLPYPEAKDLTGKWRGEKYILLITKNNSYENSEMYDAKFYFIYQNGSMGLEQEVLIENFGGGIGKLYWNDGDNSDLSWSKVIDSNEREREKLPPGYRGDIEVYCIDKLKYAESRTDCWFYWQDNI